MNSINNDINPRLTRCIVTYNTVGIPADAAVYLLHSMAVPAERFTEGSFVHLEGIGSTIINLTEHEYSAISGVKHVFDATGRFPGLSVIDVVADMTVYASAPWNNEHSIPDYLRVALHDNLDRVIQLGEFERDIFRKGELVPIITQAASLAFLTISPFSMMTSAGVIGAVMVTEGMHHVKSATVVPQEVMPVGMNLVAIKAPKAWMRGVNGSGVKIAVLDTGIDKTHPDLKGRVHRGISIVGDDSCTDRHGHGTHCSGIIAGASGIGVASGAQLYSVKVLEDNGEGFLSDVLSGMEWIIQRNNHAAGSIDIASTSIALQQDSKPAASITQAVRALKKTGCIMVSGTGNDGDDINAPANSRGVVAVGALDKERRVWRQSSFGGDYNQVTIVAPGVDVRTTGINPDERYVVMNGTSAACAHVSGVIALIKQAFPSFTPDEIVAHLKATADSSDIPDDAEKYGAGMANCDRATKMFTKSFTINASSNSSQQ